MATVTEIVLREAAHVAGASAAMLAVREGGQLRPLGLQGQALALDRTSETLPLAEHHPTCEAVRTRRPVTLLGAGSGARAYPVPPGAGGPSRRTWPSPVTSVRTPGLTSSGAV